MVRKKIGDGKNVVQQEEEEEEEEGYNVTGRGGLPWYSGGEGLQCC